MCVKVVKETTNRSISPKFTERRTNGNDGYYADRYIHPVYGR
jgi:hypothetical protein